ncbi:MAG: GIY-YIG nuclease family protein [Candidatus Falkowbacteria bacterium]
MEGYLYILQSRKNLRYYIGSTTDVQRRLSEHNTGRNPSTKNLRPLIVVFLKHYEILREARQIEYKLKKFKSRDIIEKIIKEGDIKMGP